jgi:hypothetical protein
VGIGGSLQKPLATTFSDNRYRKPIAVQRRASLTCVSTSVRKKRMLKVPRDAAGQTVMATIKWFEGHRAPAVRPLRVTDIRAAAAAWLHSEWAARSDRPWLAVVAIPLAMVATVLAGEWWTVPPLLACAWWWSPRWQWTWVVACEQAMVGALWAYLGAINLASLPSHRLAVGAVWAGFAGALAFSGARLRRGSLAGQ